MSPGAITWPRSSTATWPPTKTMLPTRQPWAIGPHAGPPRHVQWPPGSSRSRSIDVPPPSRRCSVPERAPVLDVDHPLGADEQEVARPLLGIGRLRPLVARPDLAHDAVLEDERNHRALAGGFSSGE